MLFIVHTAFVLSDNTFVWVFFKWLRKLVSPSKTFFSSEMLTCKSDLSSANCPPVVSSSRIAPQPDLAASPFD